MKVHLDTDIGGDTDDACALAMLLGTPDVELVGVTTVHDPEGRRAGYVHRLLELAGRDDVPVASSGEPSRTTGVVPGELPDELRYWGSPVAARPTGDAVDLMRQSDADGAVIVAIGPFTNLAAARPARVVLMGGWDRHPDAGLPQWGAEMDWNVTCDVESACVTAGAAADLTVVPLAVSMKAALRRADLPRLRAAGAIGALLARQAEAHAETWPNDDDRLNFQYDSVACAAALGWPMVTIEPGTLATITDIEGDRPCCIATDLDAPAFTDAWLSAIERVHRP